MHVAPVRATCLLKVCTDLVEAEGVKAEVAGQVLVVLEHRRRTDLTRVHISIRILSYVHVPVCIYEIQVIVLHRHMCIRACT